MTAKNKNRLAPVDQAIAALAALLPIRADIEKFMSADTEKKLAKLCRKIAALADDMR